MRRRLLLALVSLLIVSGGLFANDRPREIGAHTRKAVVRVGADSTPDGPNAPSVIYELDGDRGSTPTSPAGVVPTTCPLCGDCDENGTGPDILDALVAAQIAAGIRLPNATQQLCCDSDSTGTVNILDSLGMAQLSAGLPVTLVCP
ncbi:MAG: hypothetical protein GY716_09280 [bacterium]|nr:hypothetical protein [bacterium]